MLSTRKLPEDWYEGTIPQNVHIDESCYVETTFSFARYRSQEPVGVKLGKGASVYQGTMFDVGQKGRVSVGDYALLNGVWIMCDTEVIIGDYALFSWNILIMDSCRTPSSAEKRREMLHRISGQKTRVPYGDRPGQPVHIGSNVWLGFGVCILPGVQIGEGSIVGAQAVVVDDVPPFTIVGGNPAKFIRKLAPTGDPT